MAEVNLKVDSKFHDEDLQNKLKEKLYVGNMASVFDIGFAIAIKYELEPFKSDEKGANYHRDTFIRDNKDTIANIFIANDENKDIALVCKELSEAGVNKMIEMIDNKLFFKNILS